MAQLLLRGKCLGDFEGVLFDKDGTLSHSEPRLIEQGHSRIAAACDCWISSTEPSSTSEPVERLRTLLHQAYGLSKEGISPDGLLAVASRQHNLLATATVFSLMGLSWPRALLMADRSFEQAAQWRRAERPAADQNPSPLLPAAKPFLDQLIAAGVTCAVISNDTRQGIETFLRGHQLEEHMAGIWSADDRPQKPEPEAVHHLCNNLGLNPSRCALIGDADSDLLMARQAGIGLSLGYVAGWRRSPDLTEHEHLISHWDELEVIQR